MQICVKRFPHVKVFFRFVGGEQRGALTNPDVFKCFGMIQVHPNPVKIGFEVQAYKKFLFSQGIPSKLLHWAPPPLADRNSSYGASRIPNLGFLGMAKERKGFDQIPEIMLAFAKNGIKTSWTIQGTLFPWQTYTNTLEKINDIAKSHDFPLKLIPANVDLAELTSLLRGCDALVLPYDSESYAKNGSAIFYQAVELGVPMIAHSGLGFSDDLLSHNLGLTYTDVNEIPKIFQRLKADTIHFNQFIALTKSTNQTFLDL
jgi:glycosyltransferase involved in cell wall biosynthesis